MRTWNTRIRGAEVIQFDNHADPRGLFSETFNKNVFQGMGLPSVWRQDNMSVSFANTIRGLHLQTKNPQGKLIRCFAGEIFDVAVDCRPGSPTLGAWEAITLSWEYPLGFYIPPGCAHGFYVKSESAMVYYKCTTLYDKSHDAGIFWNDPDVGIEWPMKAGTRPVISPKDQALPTLQNFLIGLNHGTTISKQ